MNENSEKTNKNMFGGGCKSKHRKILIVLIILLILIITGVTLAAFNINIPGISNIVSRPAKVLLTYEEPEEALTSDEFGLSVEEGKAQDSFFEFTVSSTSEINMNISYNIYITEEETNTLDREKIYLYLTEVVDNQEIVVQYPNRLTSFVEHTTKNNSIVIENDNFKFTNNVEETMARTYRLRMWVDASANVILNEDGSQSINIEGGTYEYKVHVESIIPLDTSYANNPELSSNMIAVYYDETNNVWRKADNTNSNSAYKWHDYDTKMWANAVTITEEENEERINYIEAEPGTIIPMERINTMWVWIPRFSAVKTGMHNGGTSHLSPGPFNLTFTAQDVISHDAFTFGEEELNGFWYGKFEPSSDIECTPSDNSVALANGCNRLEIRPLIKPNMVIWRGAIVSTFFYVSRSMEEVNNPYGFLSNEVDTHMSKNREWGAVAYLTQSEYGRCTNGVCTEITINNCSSFITGIGADSISDASSSTTCSTATNMYDGEKGVLASTTGNIYGIYDMSGGALEYVMGLYKPETLTNVVDYGGFSSSYSNSQYDLLTIDEKYYDTYTTYSDYDSLGLQHALGDTSVWYGDRNYFVSASYPYFRRSGGCDAKDVAGIFGYHVYNGITLAGTGTRISLITR